MRENKGEEVGRPILVTLPRKKQKDFSMIDIVGFAEIIQVRKKWLFDVQWQRKKEGFRGATKSSILSALSLC